ncbi:MAG: helix-turn-helix transcriptional regulator [Clostridia bacterium]|nr:helix-turn-helix transcriptional regulator [Clostridia bacterium]
MATWSRSVFANNLKHYMERKGVSQKELSEIIGVSAPTLNEWIKAKKYPRIDKVEKLANYFGCLKSDLIEEKTEKQREVQKKNDILSDIILKLKEDKELLDTVDKLSKLDTEKQIAVKNVIDAFSKVDK